MEIKKAEIKDLDIVIKLKMDMFKDCLLYTSPSPRD